MDGREISNYLSNKVKNYPQFFLNHVVRKDQDSSDILLQNESDTTLIVYRLQYYNIHFARIVIIVIYSFTQ